LKHLEAALFQYGPWQGTKLEVDIPWLKDALHEKVASINWDDAKVDVNRFLGTAEQKSLELWSERFFSSKVEALG
jgi:hypothetical protein